MVRLAVFAAGEGGLFVLTFPFPALVPCPPVFLVFQRTRFSSILMLHLFRGVLVARGCYRLYRVTGGPDKPTFTLLGG